MAYRDPADQLKNQQRNRARRVEAGTCIECAHPATNGQRCPFCARKNSDRTHKNLAKPPKPESALRVDELMRRAERTRHA